MSLAAKSLALFSLTASLAGVAHAAETDDVASWQLYDGVNAFIASLEAEDHGAAADLVVPTVNGPNGHLKIPDAAEVISTLQGCEAYGRKYSRGDFPGAITRWQCGDAHYSLWLRPSYDGQPGKVQLTQFGPYSNAHLHGRGPSDTDDNNG